MPNSSVAARLERLPISWCHYRLLLIHGFGWLFDAMDVGIITFVIAALARDWKLSPKEAGLIVSVGMGGMFVGALFAGLAADRWGRKRVFQVTLLVFSISTLLCAFAWNVASMCIFRFLVGVGLGGELPVVSSLMSEFVPARHRGRFVVLLESFWAYGWIAAAVIAFLVIPLYGWRIAFGIGAVPALYIWYLRRALPESPRWLSSKRRTNEAEDIVKTMENEITMKIGKPLDLPQETQGGGDKMGETIALSSLWSRFCRPTLMLWILWFGLVFGYYGIFVWLPTMLIKAGHSMVSSFGFVIIMTIAQVPGYFSAAYLVERIGRKPVIVSFLLLTAVSAFFFGLSIGTTELVIWGCLMSFFNLGAWGGVYAYTPEQYPTLARTSGAGSAAAIGRIGGIIAPFVVGALLPTWGMSRTLMLNELMFVLAALSVALLGKETRGMSLEEIATMGKAPCFSKGASK